MVFLAHAFLWVLLNPWSLSYQPCLVMMQVLGQYQLPAVNRTFVKVQQHPGLS